MNKIVIIVAICLLAPTVQASELDSEISLAIFYDNELQSSADLIIQNKMNDQVITLESVDLSTAIDISGISPSEGDYIKITAVLDSDDPTKIRTICITYLANMALKTILMSSNSNHFGDMEVENTGGNIDWDTQNLVINGFPSASTSKVYNVNRNSNIEFRMNYDRNDNWLPQCDEGWSWEVNFDFKIHEVDGLQYHKNGYLASVGNSNQRQDGGFCTNPSPVESEEEDPELIITIKGPGGHSPSTSTFHAFAKINYDSYHYVANTLEDGTQVWDWDEHNAPPTKYEPQCASASGGVIWCYHVFEINWV